MTPAIPPHRAVIALSCLIVACAGPPRHDPALPVPTTEPSVVIMAQVGMGSLLREQVELDGRTLNVYRALPISDPRVTAARRALASPPVRRLLVLIDAARRLRRTDPPPAGIDRAAWSRAASSPFYLSVEGSLEEHGGAGFVLRTDDGDIAHPATPFVELAGTATDLASPRYAASLVHEMTHALFALAGAQWSGPCSSNLEACGRVPSAFHDIQRPTQPLQALNEGYSEHMEALAFLAQPGAAALEWALSPDGAVAAARGFVSPRARRLDHVIWNRAIFEPARIPDETIARDGIDAAHRSYQDSQPIDDHRLRTCREILSTEGAVASILTRLALDDTLARSPLPDELRAMAPAGADREGWLAALGPSGPVELRLIYLLARMPAGTPAATGEVGLRELIEHWRATFPADAPAVTRVMIAATLGTTASATLAARLRALLATPTIVPARDPQHASLRSASQELLALARSPAVAGPGLFEACGPPLWVAVPGKTLCGDFGGPCLPLELDLNAASELDLRLLPGVDAGRSRRAIEARELRGYFATREAALAAAGLGVPQAAAIAARPRPGPQ